VTTSTRPFRRHLWAQARYTISRVALAQIDPVTRWLILSRPSVIVGEAAL